MKKKRGGDEAEETVRGHHLPLKAKKIKTPRAPRTARYVVELPPSHLRYIHQTAINYNNQ